MKDFPAWCTSCALADMSYLDSDENFVKVSCQVSDLPCNVRREGGQSLVIGGSSLVILEGNACNPL